MSVFSHASVTINDGTATVRLTFVSDKVAEQYETLSGKAWRQERATDRHVTRVAAGYGGFRAYRDAFCLTFNSPDAANRWLARQNGTLWTLDYREPEDGWGEKTSVSLRNGISYQDLGMRKPGARSLNGKMERKKSRVLKKGKQSDSQDRSDTGGYLKREKGSRQTPESLSSLSSDASSEPERTEKVARGGSSRGSKKTATKNSGTGDDSRAERLVIPEPRDVQRAVKRKASESDAFYSLPGSDADSEDGTDPEPEDVPGPSGRDRRRSRSRSRSQSRSGRRRMSPENNQKEKQVLFITSTGGSNSRKRVNYTKPPPAPPAGWVTRFNNLPNGSGVNGRRRRGSNPDARESSHHDTPEPSSRRLTGAQSVLRDSIYPDPPLRRDTLNGPYFIESRSNTARAGPTSSPADPPDEVYVVERYPRVERSPTPKRGADRKRIRSMDRYEESAFVEVDRSSAEDSSASDSDSVSRRERGSRASRPRPRRASSYSDSEETEESSGKRRRFVNLRNILSTLPGNRRRRKRRSQRR